MIGADGPATQRCSRAGCGEPATWGVHWRNPRIHSEDRVKTWLACDEHVDYLRDYLATRDFPVAVTPVGETVERVAG
jgi:hypothetical protein